VRLQSRCGSHDRDKGALGRFSRDAQGGMLCPAIKGKRLATKVGTGGAP
jgi:hypothetical protein